jgi:diacylglycerol kinase (ATP)
METVTFIMHGLKISVSFFDQLNAQSRNLGLRKLKASEEMGIKCRAIVCGGDGTVLWVVRELIEHGIRIHNVPVGVIPIGTGNDFSRILGWGGKR